MKTGGALRSFLLALAWALVAYAGLYGFIQHRRVVKGPWEATFTAADGVPVLVVNQNPHTRHPTESLSQALPPVGKDSHATVHGAAERLGNCSPVLRFSCRSPAILRLSVGALWAIPCPCHHD